MRSIPEAAGRIHHVPHGAPTSFLAPQPLTRPALAPADLAHLPRPYLGYIGSLEDRVDWELMNRISPTFPDASIVVVGRVRDPVDKPWWNECARFLSQAQRACDRLAVPGGSRRLLPGLRRDAHSLSHGSSVQPGLQPDQDHGLDGVGPADRRDGDSPNAASTPSGLTSPRIADEFIDAIRTILASGSDDGRAGLRHAYALANTCHGIGERILDLI